MNDETLKALQESIAKWERNARVRKPESYRLDSTDCPLCDLFWSDSSATACVGCPVGQRSGLRYCQNTPYRDAHEAWDIWRRDPENVASARAARKAARDEVAFLKSLLPGGGRMNDEHRKNIDTLIAHLEQVPDEEFCMLYWNARTRANCRTAACIGGHIQVLADIRKPELEVACGAWIGLNEDDSSRLFFADWDDVGLEDITRQHAIAALRDIRAAGYFKGWGHFVGGDA